MPTAGPQTGEMGHQRGHGVVAQDGDPVLRLGRDLQEATGHACHLVGQPGPGQALGVVGQGGRVRQFAGTQVEWL